MSKWTIDPLLKERKEFMVEKKDESKPGEPKAGADADKDDLIPPLLPESKPEKK